MGGKSRTKGASMEVWLPVNVKGGMFRERYQVSNKGRVRSSPDFIIRGSRPGRVLFQAKDERGYRQVYLYKNMRQHTLKVHRIVAEAFYVDSKKEGMTIDHIDGDKENNQSCNLEYVSNKENCRRAYRVLPNRPSVLFKGERMSLAEAVDRYGGDGVSAKAASRRIHRLGWGINEAILTPIGKPGVSVVERVS